MSSKKDKKYVPTVKVMSDDLVVVDEESGQEHRPHEGEWVIFKRGVPMKVMRVAQRAGKVNTEDPTQAIALVEALVGILAQQIVDWNWTDVDYEALPRPRTDPEGFADALWGLESYEISWLQEHMLDGANLSKN